MNETKKRLEIIALAIALNDVETIAIQIPKLQSLEMDYHVKSIIFLLDNKNYLDAQQHITTYIATSTTSIEVPNTDNTLQSDPQLDTEIPLASLSEEDTAEISEILTPIDEPSIKPSQTIDFNLQEIPKDDFFDTLAQETIDKHDDLDIDVSNALYKNFKHLQDIYIPITPIQHISPKVKEWLNALSVTTYSEADIANILKDSTSVEETDKAEAAQLLLLAAASASEYAQFTLARALYKGTLLERDLDGSFKIMSQLAYKQKYPEALCDLAQFYENGVSVDIDTLQAETLYKEAVDLGVQRALKHYKRLQKESEGFFSFFKS